MAQPTPPPSDPRPQPSYQWVWQAGALVLWLMALALAAALASHHPPDDAANLLGWPGGACAALCYKVAGLAAWLLPVLLVLTGALMWAGRTGTGLLPLATGGLWLLLGGSCLLSLAGETVAMRGGRVAVGGGAGRAMADGLAAVVGAAPAWLVAIAFILGGLVTLWWAVVLTLGIDFIPRIDWRGIWRRWRAMADAPPPTDATAPPPPEEPQEPQEPEPPEIVIYGPTDEPAAPALKTNQGPVIKPRTPPPPKVTPPPPDLPLGGRQYRLPPLDLLSQPQGQIEPDHAENLRRNSQRLEQKLADFGVAGKVVEVAPGPVVTMYEFKPAPGVKISKVANLADDLAMNLRATSIRIVAPIPGKAVIGIEIPSQRREMVLLGEILASRAYQKARSPLTISMGKDILGQPVVDDLRGMPHLLVAGATGSGKSVFINSLVLSILYKSIPDQVRLLMIDPKRIELSTYNDIPHLLHPIITEPKEATSGLRWVFGEMERRYELLVQEGVRNIASYNRKLDEAAGEAAGDQTLPYIVVVIDELADLMMASSKEVEGLITRLAQKARAAGIHLVVATQRPSVDVITGLIKANFPARVSFQVSSRVDSRTILDVQGAEHLLGNGDMLFVPPGTSRLTRIHGAYVSDAEIAAVVEHLRSQAAPEYDESIVSTGDDNGPGGLDGQEMDERYPDAVRLVKETGQASISYVQRRLRVGYNRAARMIEQMEAEGIVGPSDGSRPREVLIRD